MKTFFTQPIGQLGRQNSLGFVGINVVLLVVGFGEIDVPIGLGNFINSFCYEIIKYQVKKEK